MSAVPATARIETPVGMVDLVVADDVLTSVRIRAGGLEEWQNSNNPLLIRAVAQMRGYFAGTCKTFDLPLAKAATGEAEQLRAAINDRTQGLMRSAVQWIVVGRQGPDQRGACQQQSCGRRGVPRDEGGERGDHRMPGRGGDMARGARASLPFRCSPTTILM